MRCTFAGITIATVVSGRLRGPARGDGGELQAGARRVPRSSSTVSKSRCDFEAAADAAAFASAQVRPCRSLGAMDVGTRNCTPRRLRDT